MLTWCTNKPISIWFGLHWKWCVAAFSQCLYLCAAVIMLSKWRKNTCLNRLHINTKMFALVEPNLCESAWCGMVWLPLHACINYEISGLLMIRSQKHTGKRIVTIQLLSFFQYWSSVSIMSSNTYFNPLFVCKVFRMRYELIAMFRYHIHLSKIHCDLFFVSRTSVIIIVNNITRKTF